MAVARKLAVLLHRLWVGGEVYEPPRPKNVSSGFGKPLAEVRYGESSPVH